MAIVAIPGAENIVLDEILATPEIGAKDQPVVLMCKSGMRSAQAASALRENGYERVYELSGGVLSWVASVAPHEATY